MAKLELELSARQLPVEIQAVHDFIESGVPTNTVKSYRGALNLLSMLLGDPPLNDASYLTSLFAQGRVKASAVLVVSAVNKMAKSYDQPSPVGGLANEALSSYRRQARDRDRGSIRGIRFEVAGDGPPP